LSIVGLGLKELIGLLEEEKENCEFVGDFVAGGDEGCRAADLAGFVGEFC
jgi:hypothetical protein